MTRLQKRIVTELTKTERDTLIKMIADTRKRDKDLSRLFTEEEKLNGIKGEIKTLDSLYEKLIGEE